MKIEITRGIHNEIVRTMNKRGLTTPYQHEFYLGVVKAIDLINGGNESCMPAYVLECINDRLPIEKL